MRTFAILTLALANAAMAQLPANSISRSASGQFLVVSRAGDMRRLPLAVSTNATLLRLDAQFATVSAERTRQTIYRILEANDTWEYPISVTLQRPQSPSDVGTVTPGYLGPRRAYHVQLPAMIAPSRYLQTLTEAVLMEIAGRNAKDGAVEIPAWLTEGITYHLLGNHTTELLLSAPSRSDNGLPMNRMGLEYRQFSPLEKAHRVLVGTAPLSFEELSWPRPEQLSGSSHELYQASAQVFLFKLLKLADGPACLRNFLNSLPAHQNWQLAFLEAFEPHFKRPLDIEKWWTLEGFNFAQRDLTHTWPLAESWNKLDAVLTERVDLFTSTNSLPESSDLSLTQLIESWSADQQDPVLDRKRLELRQLMLRLAPEIHPLAAEYVDALDDYLRFRSAAPANSGTDRIGANSLRFAELKLLKRLNSLEAERARLRLDSTSPAVGAGTDTTASLREMRLPASALRAN